MIGHMVGTWPASPWVWAGRYRIGGSYPSGPIHQNATTRSQVGGTRTRGGTYLRKGSTVMSYRSANVYARDGSNLEPRMPESRASLPRKGNRPDAVRT